MRLAPALLALVLLAPVAGADDLFSHRLYVVGRVVDADGVPPVGVPVETTFAGVRGLSGRCYDGIDEVTGAKGDFVVCRHAHAVQDDATVTLTVGNASRTLALDPDLRLASASVQLAGTASSIDLDGARAFNRTFLVAGRHFALVAKPTEVEGVVVNATPVMANVTARLLAQGRELASATARPNEHGDYRIDLAVGELPSGAIVRVESGGDATEEPASALFRRADTLLVRDERLADGPGANAPGAAPGKVPVPGALALAALAFSAFAWRRARRRG